MTCTWLHLASKDGDIERLCGRPCDGAYCTEHRFILDVLEETDKCSKEIETTFRELAVRVQREHLR